MSIPLVQNNEKDSINTSIIAIKRNIERINMLLGLVDSGSPDLSGLATKQELENAVTEINDTIDEVETSLQPVDTVTSGNMQSVTSNAVAEKIENISSYIIGEVYTGGTWIDGKKVYRRVDTLTIKSLPAGNSSYPFTNSYWSEIESVISIRIIRPRATGILFAQIDCGKRFNPSTKVLDVYGVTTEWSGPFLLEFIYTKTTD